MICDSWPLMRVRDAASDVERADFDVYVRGAQVHRLVQDLAHGVLDRHFLLRLALGPIDGLHLVRDVVPVGVEHRCHHGAHGVGARRLAPHAALELHQGVSLGYVLRDVADALAPVEHRPELGVVRQVRAQPLGPLRVGLAQLSYVACRRHQAVPAGLGWLARRLGVAGVVNVRHQCCGGKGPPYTIQPSLCSGVSPIVVFCRPVRGCRRRSPKKHLRPARAGAIMAPWKQIRQCSR